MTWKSLLKQWLLVALLVLSLDRLVGWLVVPLYRPEQAPVWRTGNPNPDHAYGHLRSAVQAQADMLIAGSSRALANYDDELLSQQLGIRVYNAGSPGLGVLQARATLALAQRVHPVRYLLLDAVYVPLEDRMIHRLEPWMGIDPVIDEMLAGDWREWLKTRSFAYRCGGSLFDLAEDYGKAGAPWGYQPGEGPFTQIPDLAQHLPAQLPGWFCHNLEGLAQDCQRQSTRLILVESPTLQPVASTQSVAQEFLRISQKYHLLRLRPALIPNDQSEYRDGIHLNRHGSQIFSQTLAQQLRKITEGK